MKKQIKEDVPVTTTNNGGNGLNSPVLPIERDSILTRFKKMKKNRDTQFPLNTK